MHPAVSYEPKAHLKHDKPNARSMRTSRLLPRPPLLQRLARIRPPNSRPTSSRTLSNRPTPVHNRNTRQQGNTQPIDRRQSRTLVLHNIHPLSLRRIQDQERLRFCGFETDRVCIAFWSALAIERKTRDSLELRDRRLIVNIASVNNRNVMVDGE
ncbi:hypothetical protein E6O75_ATG03308 [Venturia nashicola]|uniref:Uncharacterized protein n=1 Tax=Venturia nashicola TaxID=86259 RepID=A0A4Z1PMG0_9PEZI|nr:hypothetical protein E6O75_ATG03308 [Venturia nashicola]